MKIYSNQNVYDAARERVAFVFDEFDQVIVSMSGGKDSTVTLELAYEEAERRGRLPLKVLFVDQEAEWGATIAYIEALAERPGIDLWWIQIPFMIDNVSSFFDDILMAWGEGCEWIRPQSPLAITDPSLFGKYRDPKEPLHDFHYMFKPIQRVVADNKRYAVLYGLRVEESPSRRIALTKVKGGYKGKAWAQEADKKLDAWRFSVIWDWQVGDVWTAMCKFGWEYNKVYDVQYQYGIPVRSQRVSSLTHGIAAHHTLKMLQEVEPKTYEALSKRLPGISTFSKMQGDVKSLKLPPAFTDWKEYFNYLLVSLPTEKMQAGFAELFKSRKAVDMPDSEEKWKLFAQLVLTNDYLGVRLQDFVSRPEYYYEAKKRKQEKKRLLEGGNDDQ